MKFLAVVCALVLHGLLLSVEGDTCEQVVDAHPSTCGAGDGIFAEFVADLAETSGMGKFEKTIKRAVPFIAELVKDLEDAEYKNEKCLDKNENRDRTNIEAFKKYEDRLACTETEFLSYGKKDGKEDDMVERASPLHARAQASPNAATLKNKDPNTVKRTLAAKTKKAAKTHESPAIFLETATKGRNVKKEHRPLYPYSTGLKKGEKPSLKGLKKGETSWLKEGEKCLSRTFEYVRPAVNIALEAQKKYLLQKVKDNITATKLPSQKGVTFQGNLNFDQFNIDQILIEQHPDRKQLFTLKLKGIDVKLRRLKLQIRRKLFFMFLQTGERKLFSRRDSQRLQKGKKSKKKKKGGFFKKIGKGIKKGFKKVGKFVKKAVQVVKTVVTNKVKCDGWVEAEYGKADLEASIEFTDDPKNFINVIPPKIDVSKLKINFHVDNVCEIAVKFKGKGKIINMIKGKVEQVLNDKIPELEKKVEKKMNSRGNGPLLKMCRGEFMPMRWIENVLSDKCLVGTVQQFINMLADFREYLRRIDGEEGDRIKNLPIGSCTKDYIALMEYFDEQTEKMNKFNSQPEKRAIGMVSSHIRKALGYFFNATADELRINLCDLANKEADNTERIPKLLKKMATKHQVFLLIASELALVKRVVKDYKKKNNAIFSFGWHEGEVFSPFRKLFKDPDSVYYKLRNAKSSVTFKGKGGKDLSTFSLKKMACDAARGVIKTVLYHALLEKDKTGGKEMYDNLMEAFNSKYFLRSMDNVLQLLRDGAHAVVEEEEYQIRVQGKERKDTTTQKDLNYLKAKIRRIPGDPALNNKDKRILKEMKKSFEKAIDLLYKIAKKNPSGLYVNVYSPLVLTYLAGDFVEGHLHDFVDLIEHIIVGSRGILSFKGHTPHPGPFALEIKSILTGTRATWDEATARLASCRRSGENIEGKCYHLSRPCPNIEDTMGLASHCTPCTFTSERCVVGSEKMHKDREPRRPWNLPTELTVDVLRDQALDTFARGQNIYNTYHACIIKESPDNIEATENQCPGLALPEPNLFKLFRRKETGKFAYWWDSSSKKYKFKNDDIEGWVRGDSLDGFNCSEDCKNCYGEKGYSFPNAAGYNLSAIPVTSTYSADGTEIPWIREENWDIENGFYRPRCECEPSYAENRHVCKVKKYSDNTMVCELIRNGGILNGCHQGRFVVSGIRERDGDRKCFLVEIDLTKADHALLAPGIVPNKTLDYTRQCLREHIGSFVKSRSPKAHRAVPTVTPLRKTCLSGWERSEMSSKEVTFCRKTAVDSFETALKTLNKNPNNLNQIPRRKLLQANDFGS